MENLNLNDLGLILEKIRNHIKDKDNKKETTNGINYSGQINDEIVSIICELKEYIITSKLEKSFLFILDEVEEDWDSLSFKGSKKWELSIGDKQQLLNNSSNSEDIKELLFFDKEYFSQWLEKASGLANPIEQGFLTAYIPHKIYVYDLEHFFGGPRIAIIPLSKRFTDLSVYGWLNSTKLPSIGKIQKTVHFISSDVVDFSPENFLITWGDINCELATKFHVASAKSLLYTVVQEYYNDNKIILNGKKRIEVKMSDNREVSIDKESIETLVEVVSWCYAENDETTRILLLVDRLSLDIDEKSCLLGVVKNKINTAFNEAKSRYKYVVLDRKAEYTKELSELQKDIVGVIDKYISSTNEYILSFLRDILTFAFILTVGVVSKKIVNENLLFSKEADIFFKAFAIYLAFSLLLRLWHFIFVVKQAEKLIISWKNIVRNHMSAQELKEHIRNALSSAKLNFKIVLFVVSLLYIFMSIISWNSNKTFNYIFNESITITEIKEEK